MQNEDDMIGIGASKAVRTGYKTFPEEDNREFQWEAFATPWVLFMKAAISSGKIIFSLTLLVILLLRVEFDHTGLKEKKTSVFLSCDPKKLSLITVGLCEYTKAYLRAFPLLALCITAAVTMRLMLQTRIYYGLLKRGGLLDFKNIQGWQDPMLILMAFSLLHGVAHFVLKICDGFGDLSHEVFQILQAFLIPSALFMAFFYSSYDLESTLVPLNKYIEEDPEYCQQAIANMQLMDEFVLSKYVLENDVIAQVYPEGSEDTEMCITKVYDAMIREYARAQNDSRKNLVFHMRITETIWPAKIILDHRLTDDSSTQMRIMFLVFLCICFPIQIFVLADFMYQAFWKDAYIDAYLGGQTADLLGTFVLAGHALIVGWVFFSTVGPVQRAMIGWFTDGACGPPMY